MVADEGGRPRFYSSNTSSICTVPRYPLRCARYLPQGLRVCLPVLGQALPFSAVCRLSGVKSSAFNLQVRRSHAAPLHASTHQSQEQAHEGANACVRFFFIVIARRRKAPLTSVGTDFLRYTPDTQTWKGRPCKRHGQAADRDASANYKLNQPGVVGGSVLPQGRMVRW